MPQEASDRLELRYYDMPQKCPVLCLYGERWKMPYGDTGDPEQLHFHNVLEIGICREGEGEMVYPHERKLYRPGDISIIPRNLPHSTKSDYSWWEYVFIDTQAYLDRFMWKEVAGHKWHERINSRALLIREEEHVGIREAVDAMIREHQAGEAYAHEVMDTCALELLFLIARENRDYNQNLTTQVYRDDRKIRTALDYIENHFEEEITIGELADKAGMSEPHFRRLFREIINMTPGDYLNMVRVRHACNMLLSTDLSVELIAERSGYMTPSTFNRNFRRFLQTTPLQWRKDQILAGNRSAGIQIAAYRGWGQEVTE